MIFQNNNDPTIAHDNLLNPEWNVSYTILLHGFSREANMHRSKLKKIFLRYRSMVMIVPYTPYQATMFDSVLWNMEVKSSLVSDITKIE